MPITKMTKLKYRIQLVFADLMPMTAGSRIIGWTTKWYAEHARAVWPNWKPNPGVICQCDDCAPYFEEEWKLRSDEYGAIISLR